MTYSSNVQVAQYSRFISEEADWVRKCGAADHGRDTLHLIML